MSTTAIVSVSAAVFLGAGTFDAVAQSATWNGVDSAYNTGSNWSTGTAPVAGGSSALFSNAGNATVNVLSAITPDAWTFNAGAQSYTITGAAVNFGGTGITNNAASNISIANNIGGTGAITQAGAGILTLSGTNTFTGGTSITGGTLNVAGTLKGPVSLSNGTTLHVAAGGAISRAGAVVVGGSGAFTIVNLGSMTNTGSSNVNTNGTVNLITGAGSVLSSDKFEAFAAAGAGSQLTNAAGATIQGGSDAQYGNVLLGNNGTVTNYGTMSGGATLAGGNNTSGALVVGTNSTVDLREGSTTGTVRLGNGSTLSLYTGSGNTAGGASTIDPVTGVPITLQNAGTNAAATVGAIAFDTGGTLALRGTGDGTAANGVSGALNMSNVSGVTTLSKQDSGTFVLTSNYAGTVATNVTGGRLVESNTAGAFGAGTVAISTGTTVEVSNTTGTVLELLGIAFTGAGTLEKTGVGIDSIGGTTASSVGLSQGGLINVVAGTLRGSTQNRGSWTTNNGGLTIASGATFDGVEGTIRVDALNGAGTLQGGATTTVGVANGSGVFTGTIQNSFYAGGTFTLTKAGAGTQTLTGANTYTGGTTFGGGILNVGSAGAIGTTGTLSFTGGTLQYSASNQTDYSARFSTAASQAYQIDTNSRAVTYATALTSTNGSLTKFGLGTLTLAGASTYSGATTINAGTLTLANAAGTAIADGSRVAFGNAAGTAATLQTNYSETIGSLAGGNTSSTVAIAAGTTLTVGGDATTASYAGAINANGTGVLAKTGSGTQTLNGAITGGSLQVLDNGGTLTLGPQGTFTTNGTLLPGYVPALLGVGIGTGATFSNAGIITLTGGSTDGVQLRGGTFNNTGTLTGGGGSAVYSPLGGTIVNTGQISGGSGVFFTGNTGSSTLTVTGGGSITGNGYGIGADNGSGNVTLGTMVVGEALGNVTGQSAIYARTSGAGAIGIVTGGNVTSNGANSIGIDASSVNGAVAVTQTGGLVQASATGISASSTGTGTVTVSAGPITTTNGSGIVATGTSGTVAVTANGAVTASGAGNSAVFLTGNAVDNSVIVSANQTVQGAIGLRIAGTGTTTLANSGTIASTATNGNALQVDGGTVTIGNTLGTLTGNLAVVNTGSTLTVNRTAGLTLANTVTGAGVLNQNGSGATILNGVNGANSGQFTGTANVNAGILSIGDAATPGAVFGDTVGNTAIVNVNNSGTLHGAGTIAGSVAVASGGTVSAGNSPGTLTVAQDYALAAGSTSLFELGTPGIVGGTDNDLINVGRNLTLGGTLNAVSSANGAASPVAGEYRLYTYGGTLNGAFASVMTPTAQSATVLTNISGQVNLLIANAGQSLQYWDGADTTGATAGGQGGTGTWSSANTNWTGSTTSQTNNAWQSGIGIFGGTAATVTIAGAQRFQGLQFTVDGYTLAGAGTLNVAGDPFSTATQSFVTVNAGVGVTIANAITSTGGAFGLVKLGTGTLTLTGASSYTGDTTVSNGILAIAAGGSVTSNVSNAATFNNAGTVTGTFANSGTASNSGTVTGAATVSAGTVSNTGVFASTLGLTGGSFTNNTGGHVAGTATNNGGTLTNNGGSLAAVINSSGTFANNSGTAGAVSNAATASNAGTIASLANSGGTFGNTGTVTGASSVSGGTASNTGAFGSTLGLTGGSFTNNTGGSVAGTATNNGGTLTNNGGRLAAVTNSIGTFANNSGTAGAVSNAATASNAGTIASLANSGGTFGNTGTVTGASSVSGGTASNTGAFGSTLGLTGGSFTNNTGGSVAGTATNDGGTLTNNGGRLAAVTNSSGTFANNSGTAGAVSNAATASNAGTIASLANSGGTFGNTGTIAGSTNVSGGSLTTTGTLGDGLTNSATVNANGGAINGAIANNAGTFNVGGTVTSNNTFANASGATFAVAGTGSYTLQGMLTNAGILTVANGGLLNATAGGLTITKTGTVTVAQGGTLRDDLNNAGTVTNNGNYVANVAFNSGSIANTATGTWTGNVASNSGAIGNAGLWTGNVLSNTGSLSNSATWTGSIVTSGTFANATGATVSGLVTNSGTTTNAGTFNGGLTNTAGTTTNNGVISGPVTVSGGTLTGSGRTANLAVSSGIFSPGNGTAGSSMTVNGNLALASAVQYVVQINSATASFASVTGTAALGGAVVTANFASGSYVTRQYTILTSAGGRTGTFGALTKTNLPTNFNANLSYDANRAFLNLTLDYTKVGGLNLNQQNVANTLTGYFNRTGGIPLAFGSLSAAGLSQLSGELGAGTQQATFDAMGQFIGMMSDPSSAGRDGATPQGAVGYADEPPRASGDAFAAMSRKAPALQFEQRWNVWSAGFGGQGTTDGNAATGSSTSSSRIYGGAVGADYRVSPNTTAGFALAGGGTSFSVANGGSGRSDLFQAGGFVRHSVGATYLTAALAYGWQDVTTERSVGADRLNARFSTNTLSGRLEAGHRWIDPVLRMGLTPYAAVQVTSVSLPNYSETAGAVSTFGLNYAARDVTASRSEFGFRTDKAFAMGDGVMTLRSRAAWAHNFDPDRSITATFQTLPGASFVVNGAAQATDAALVTGSAEMAWLNGWTLAATFEGEFSNVTRSYAGKGVLRYGW